MNATGPNTIADASSRPPVAALAVLLVLTSACASAPTPTDEPPAPAAAIPQPVGEHYVIHYVDATGVRRRDTREPSDRVLVPLGGTEVEGRESPDKRKIAIAFPRADSTVLGVIDATTGNVVMHHAVHGKATYTFQWSQDSQRLGVGFYTRGRTQGTEGGVMLVASDGGVSDVGCSVSNRVVAWTGNGNLVVGDGRNFYIVSTRGCRTLATIPLAGKEDVAFSPNGRKMVLKRAPADQFSRQRAGGRLELHVADYNGANSQRVTDYRYQVQNVRWSPDSRKIAFEMKSQRFANLTHIAVYDLARGQATFDAQERTLGQPDDSDPHWSPDADRIVHDRAFARQSAGRSYSTNQKVVKSLPPRGATLSSGPEEVIAEELAQEGAVTGDPIGRTLGWIDDERLAFASARWTRIHNLTTDTSYDLPPGVRLLSVHVVDGGA